MTATKFLIIILFLVLKYNQQAQDTITDIKKDSLTNPNTTKGIASFYHQKFNGRKTTSGAIFNNNELTGAHKYLKFGTLVKVRNLKNDSIVIVKITDRLPQNSKRTIDLTMKAAKQLNFIASGLTKVEITILDSLKL